MTRRTAQLKPGTGKGSVCALILCAAISASCSMLSPAPGHPKDPLAQAVSERVEQIESEDQDRQDTELFALSPAAQSTSLQSELRQLYDQDFIASDDLWQRIRAGFRLNPDIDNARIQAELKWYLAHPQHLQRTLERAERYLHYIVEQVEQRDLPMELALLPVVESAFHPYAYSHGRAAGLWQFIPSTGRMFGLEQDWWHDGRRDVISSTDAALTYLQSLAERFDGDWLLALAAYNSGAGTVAKAMRENSQNGKPADFWNLSLPKETQAYVPRLLAVTKLLRQPKAHGLELTPLANKPYFEVVDIGSQIELSQAAQLADISVEELRHLNPAYNQWATHPDGPHRLLIPADKVESFRQALAALPPEQRTSWIRHTVKAGESLSVLASKYHTTAPVIRQVNKLQNDMIRAGQALLIPVAQQDPNGLQAQGVALSGVAKASGQEHRVQPGDTWWDLARKYQVDMNQLARLNQMNTRQLLKPGLTLKIPARKESRVQMASLTSGDGQGVVHKVNYKVRNGDSLFRIANKFNVSVKEIATWNRIDPNHHLKPGQKLNLYVDVTRGN